MNQPLRYLSKDCRVRLTLRRLDDRGCGNCNLGTSASTDTVAASRESLGLKPDAQSRFPAVPPIVVRGNTRAAAVIKIKALDLAMAQ